MGEDFQAEETAVSKSQSRYNFWKFQEQKEAYEVEALWQRETQVVDKIGGVSRGGAWRVFNLMKIWDFGCDHKPLEDFKEKHVVSSSD